MNEHHDARDAQTSLHLLLTPWRVGRKVPRNIYAQVHDELRTTTY